MIVNPLYECGYQRVGCIGCPLATYHGRLKEFSDFPKYKQLYINAFDKMIEENKKRGIHRNNWNSGEEVFKWWIEEHKHNVPGQITMNEWLENNKG